MMRCADGVVDCGAFRCGLTLAIFVPWDKAFVFNTLWSLSAFVQLRSWRKTINKEILQIHLSSNKGIQFDQAIGQSIQPLGNGKHPIAWLGLKYNQRRQGRISNTLPHTIQDNVHCPPSYSVRNRDFEDP